MDEVLEKSNTSATPEANKHIAEVRRKSTVRVTPQGSLSLSSNGEKVLSRYMRTPTGSCHDLCKYGRKHASEVQNHVILASFNISKSNEKKNLARSAPQKTKLSDGHKIIENRKRSPFNGMEAHEVPNSKKNYPSAVKKRSASLAPKASMKSPIKNKASSPAEIVQKSERTASTSKAKVKAMKPASLPNDSGSISDQSFRKNNTINDLDMARTGGNKALKPSLASLSPQTPAASPSRLNQTKHMTAKHGSPMRIKEVEKPDYENDSNDEKILHVIDQESDNVDWGQLISSLPNEEEESNISESEFSEVCNSKSIDEETKSKNNNSKCDNMMRPRRRAAVHQENNFSPPQKLSFRKGKVLELQVETEGPRRLTFRKTRVVNESRHNSEAESIVLRNQDIEKKDILGLFNHVIEETASKLVKSRKSKVQALVGAFETVISLQERKMASAV